MQKISTCQCLIERLKTFKELNLDFSCKFENIFNLNVSEAFPILYSEPTSKHSNYKEILYFSYNFLFF